METEKTFDAELTKNEPIGNNASIWPSDLQKPYVNRQPTENKVKQARGFVDIVDVWLTIQGEGPFHGYPAVFIRTAGCNLLCPLCDTDYTTNRKLYSPPQIVDRVQTLRKNCLVVITGGEPLRQDIGALCKLLINTKYSIQIETNGTYWWDNLLWNHPNFHIVCSPKTPKLHPNIIPYIGSYKYVLTAGEIDEGDGLPTSVLGSNIIPYRPPTCLTGVPIYVSPADEQNLEKNEANLRATIQSVLKHNYRLSTQSHKEWGLP